MSEDTAGAEAEAAVPKAAKAKAAKPKADKAQADKAKADKPKADKPKADKVKAGAKAKPAGKTKGKTAPPDPQGAISVARHPRVARAVRCARGWGGIAGLALGLVLALRAGVPPLQAMTRALAGGVAAYIVMWALAVAIARQVVVAEVRARGAELLRAIAAESSPDHR